MRRLVAAAIVLLVGVALTALALAPGASSGAGARTANANTLVQHLAGAEKASRSDVADGSHQGRDVRVATTVLDVPTAIGGALRTEVFYPATLDKGELVPERRGAPYPLIVFSQGFDLPVGAYASLLGHWAAAGFVVAAPTYPYTAPPGPLDEADIINHPAELRSVISALATTAREPSSALSGLVNPAEVGLAGHSDGGDVSLAVADNTCCHDPAVRAVAVLSGAELSSFGGTYFSGPQVPLLVVQGSEDSVNVPACSAQIYDQARGSRFYLDLLGAGHESPYISDKDRRAGLAQRYRSLVAAVTTYFFEAELALGPHALASLERAGNVPGLARLVAGGEAPTAASWCPGSPA